MSEDSLPKVDILLKESGSTIPPDVDGNEGKPPQGYNIDEEPTLTAATDTIKLVPNSTFVSSPPSDQGSTGSPSARSLKRSPWEQDILTPDQFACPARESLAAWTGERRLLLAVLKEAVHTYHRYCQAHTRREQRLFGEVQEWIWARDTDHLYAFESICSYLDLDPNFIRTGLPRVYAQSTSSTFPVGTRRKEQPLPAEATSLVWGV